MTLWVFPSGDIHLVRPPNRPNMTVDLRIILQNRAGLWIDASTIDNIRVQFEQVAKNPAGVDHVITGFVGRRGPAPSQFGVATPATVSPSATAGTSFHVVTASSDSGVIRVTTHVDVTALFPGDHSVSAFAGESDRVLTVYARFTEGAFEDVTGHPWLTYDSVDKKVATVDPEGRVHAVSAGATTVHVTTWDGRSGFNVPITVRPALKSGLGAARNCETLKSELGASVVIDELFRRTARHKTTLYVLAEGFRDCARFFNQARRIVRELFQTRPYIRFSDRFHAIGVFQQSPDQGVTIGPRLVGSPGAAGERALWEGQVANQPVQPVPAARLFTRDTLFGLMAGSRLVSTPQVPSLPPTRAEAEAVFMKPRMEKRFIGPDDRRLPRFGIDTDTSFTPVPPNTAFENMIQRYLEAAGQTVGPNDRVAFLVDDEFYVGTMFDVFGIPLHHLPMIAFSNGSESKIIHGVGGAGPVFDRAPVTGTFYSDRVGSTFAHEIAHTYHLADEYEDQRDQVVKPGYLETFENIQHDTTLRLPGAQGPLRGDPTAQPPLRPALDVKRIKWNIHRIAKISPVLAIAAAGSNARLTLERGQARRWTRGERAFVRNSLVTPKDTTADPRTTAIEVKIVTFDAALDTVDVTLPAGFAIASLGDVLLLYVPKRSNGVDVGLVDPAVLRHLAAQGPFPKPTPCTGGDKETWNDDQDASRVAKIEGFSFPDVNADAIGLYEGAGNVSCDMFRPAGRCKMRKKEDLEIVIRVGGQMGEVESRVVIIGFCFVCQYVLVELNDPSKHEALDHDYPRDC